MQILGLGHAGMLVKTAAGSVLCDPWFNPAYFASWFPFPDNSGVDVEELRKPDYLYVSHLHRDHFDPEWLSEYVDKKTRVLLPEYPTDDLQRALAAIGFRRFVRTRDAHPVELDGLTVMIHSLTSPTDGPIGDSAIALSDGTHKLLNQNDARPVNSEALLGFGPFDVHLLQFSGAIWYPMVYDYSSEQKAALGRRKRTNGMDRAMNYIRQYDARHVLPIAGPPCFLDDDLFSFNDVDRDPTNVFPDQKVFLGHLAAAGIDNGQLLLPGSVATLSGEECRVEHALRPADIADVFDAKEGYLRDYQSRRRPQLEAARASWPRPGVDLLGELAAWWEPLLAQADRTCAGVNGRVLLATRDAAGDDESIVIDFLDRTVRKWAGEPCRYTFWVDRPLLETCVAERRDDWVNELFLSCRFEAHREGGFNEYVYNWFKSLSEERLAYVEGYYASESGDEELVRADGYLVQRRCPHLKADLSRFGSVEDGVLTCSLHGWQFELSSGRCLTSDDRTLHSRPDDDPAGDYPQVPSAEQISVAAGG